MLVPEFWQYFGTALAGTAGLCLIILGLWFIGGFVFAWLWGLFCKAGRGEDDE